MQEGDSKPGAGHWQFKSEAGNDPAPKTAERQKTIEWTASEYIAHHKSFGWYLMLFSAAIVLAALVFLATRDRMSAIVILVCALVFALAAARKPRVLPYRLDLDGLTIGQKFYPYANYKAFAIVQEGSFANISFLPLKRFMPTLSVYFAPEDEERIVTVLAQYLPMQPGSHGLFDSLMHRLRF